MSAEVTSKYRLLRKVRGLRVIANVIGELRELRQPLPGEEPFPGKDRKIPAFLEFKATITSGGREKER